ncbi:MAG: EAL domain-containing protein [Sulfurimonas sp.]|nr:EAL domain-containing protein [Sulfurimonas sp.]MBU3937974.1 EAL domain-containing protein [bacterium]MBU4024012.1 EAL domain-containing protein [bacterium]MBU4058479.1 EAL domain-containing protein [bacterium]
MLHNFLTSGFEFTKNELELKLKYQFFNLLLAFNMSAVALAGIFRFYRGENLQCFVDFVYTIISAIMIFLVRRNKKIFPLIVHSAMIVALITVSLTFMINVHTHNFIGISWFYLEVLVVFFLTDKKFSLSIIAISVLIILSTMYIEMGMEGIKAIAFGLIPFLVFSLFVSLYEKRNSIQNELLREQYKLLEAYSYNIENFDFVTVLPNKNLFIKNLNHKIDSVEKREKAFSLIKINIDDFKTINDTYGHSFGDKLLRETVTRLQKVLYKENNLSRIGADEFIVISESITADELMKIAEDVQKEMQQKVSIDNKNVFITCSIGIALYAKDGNDVETLMKNIDSALHDAKKYARNSIRFYNTQLTQHTDEKLSMIAELKHAVEYKEFEVYYQAQIDASINKLVGMEALVRWNHPTKGFIPPDKFIPFAEEYGLIKDIDYLVMQQAMKHFMYWKQQYQDIGRLSINLSVKLLETPSYLQDIKQIMQNLSFSPHELELEITESYIMNDIEKSIEVLREISELGIELAIDDFGTGYSSLAYLQKLPFNKLKIDHSFIKNITQDTDEANLVKSIIHIAQALNLSVIAEGVETEAQKEFLIKNGCNFIQGYYYSKPLSAADMFRYIQTLQY